MKTNAGFYNELERYSIFRDFQNERTQFETDRNTFPTADEQSVRTRPDEEKKVDLGAPLAVHTHGTHTSHARTHRTPLTPYTPWPTRPHTSTDTHTPSTSSGANLLILQASFAIHTHTQCHHTHTHTHTHARTHARTPPVSIGSNLQWQRYPSPAHSIQETCDRMFGCPHK